jgi:hypothetical protein
MGTHFCRSRRSLICCINAQSGKARSANVLLRAGLVVLVVTTASSVQVARAATPPEAQKVQRSDIEAKKSDVSKFHNQTEQTVDPEKVACCQRGECCKVDQ